MVSIELPENVAAHLNKIAHDENRNIAEVVESLLEQYTPAKTSKAVDWSLILGVSDADIDDMSTSVRETLSSYYQQKYADSD